MKPGKISERALLVARATLLVDATPAKRAVLLPGSAEWSQKWLDAAGPTGLFEIVMQSPLFRRLVFWLERRFTPGVLLHFFTRKRWFAQAIQDAIASGIKQYVIIGAGLDPMAWRLKAQNPKLFCVELDQLATQAVKAAAKGPEERLHPLLVPMDLETDYPDTVLNDVSGFDFSEPAFYIIEGQLPYLPRERVEAIISRLAKVSAPGSRLAFSFMEVHSGRPLGFRGRRWWWRLWRGCPPQWGVDRAEITPFLSSHGWSLLRLSSRAEMRQQLLAPLGRGLEREPLASGESLVVAEKPLIP